MGGERRPVLFGYAALYAYEKKTGEPIAGKLAEFSAGSYSIVTVVDLILCGLECGHNKEKKDINFDEYDVAEWLTDDVNLVGEIMAHFADSMPQEPAKKKTIGKPPAKKK